MRISKYCVHILLGTYSACGLSQHLVLKPDNDRNGITSVTFANGAVLKCIKDCKISDGGIAVYDSTGKPIQQIEADVVNIVAAAPNSTNAKAALIYENCSGTICSAPKYSLVLQSHGKIRNYAFHPINDNFKILLSFGTTDEPVVKAIELQGFSHINRYGDRVRFKYVFANKVGFVREGFQPKYVKLVGRLNEAFFANAAMREPLFRAMGGEKFRQLRSSMGVESSDGSRLANERYVVFSGCMPHSCNTNQGTVVIDGLSGAAYAAYFDLAESEFILGATASWNADVADEILASINYENQYARKEDQAHAKTLYSRLKAHFSAINSTGTGQ